MRVLQGKPVVGGRAEGDALVTGMPINFTAAFSKPANLIPGRRSEIQDRHHELYRNKVKGTVLIFPAAIGSTYTGMVLLNLMHEGEAPAALVVQKADTLLASGSILARVWFDCGVPLIECAQEDLFDLVRTGDRIEVDGDTGRLMILHG